MNARSTHSRPTRDGHITLHTDANDEHSRHSRTHVDSTIILDDPPTTSRSLDESSSQLDTKPSKRPLTTFTPRIRPSWTTTSLCLSSTLSFTTLPNSFHLYSYLGIFLCIFPHAVVSVPLFLSSSPASLVSFVFLSIVVLFYLLTRLRIKESLPKSALAKSGLSDSPDH